VSGGVHILLIWFPYQGKHKNSSRNSIKIISIKHGHHPKKRFSQKNGVEWVAFFAAKLYICRKIKSRKIKKIIL
jgi:hypothetical protein